MFSLQGHLGFFSGIRDPWESIWLALWHTVNHVKTWIYSARASYVQPNTFPEFYFQIVNYLCFKIRLQAPSRSMHSMKIEYQSLSYRWTSDTHEGDIYMYIWSQWWQYGPLLIESFKLLSRQSYSVINAQFPPQASKCSQPKNKCLRKESVLSLVRNVWLFRLFYTQEINGNTELQCIAL